MTPDQIRKKIVDLTKQIADLQVQLSISGSIYLAAKTCLHTHITLDPSVPKELGCAEAVSFVLKKAGVSGLPGAGFPGTSALYSWLGANFQIVTSPMPGDVIISPTGTSSISSPHGHTGIVAQYGVLSNDSDTGLWLEKYTLDTWKTYFGDTLGFPIYYFRQK